MTVEALREELAFFEEKKSELLASHKGQFVLIKGRQIIGVYPTRAEAYGDGVRHFMREAFLIKPVVEHEAAEQVPLLAYTIQRADI